MKRGVIFYVNNLLIRREACKYNLYINNCKGNEVASFKTSVFHSLFLMEVL